MVRAPLPWWNTKASAPDPPVMLREPVPAVQVLVPASAVMVVLPAPPARMTEFMCAKDMLSVPWPAATTATPCPSRENVFPSVTMVAGVLPSMFRSTPGAVR
jgi:hypothetical protein